jgi:small-conductance mechanosensitive channel
MLEVSQQPQLLVSIAVFLGLAGIVIWHLQGRDRPTERLLAQIVCFIGMTTTIHLAGLVPYRFAVPHFDESGAVVVVAKVLWWTHLAWATIGFVRIYIVLDRRPREARLVQDLLVAFVYLGVFLSVLAFVFGVKVATLLATSGVVAIILGLALQNTLGDVFSGVALTLGRTYAIGDWVLLGDGAEGRIVGSNWRSTHLLTTANNLMILPNSVLAKQSLTNISKPDETHLIVLPVNVVPNLSPQSVLSVMQEVLKSSNTIVQEPPPSVSLVGINGAAMELNLLFRVRSPLQRIPARNEIIDLVYRHCTANGVVLALPPSTMLIQEVTRKDESLLSSLSEGQAGAYSQSPPEGQKASPSSATLLSFEPGDTIVSRMGMIRTGAAEMLMEEGTTIRLGPGDVIGGVSPDPSARYVNPRALTRVTLFELNEDVPTHSRYR